MTELTRKAKIAIESLSQRDQIAVNQRLAQIDQSPDRLHSDVKRLTTSDGITYVARAGNNLRIIFTVNGEKVTVVDVAHRVGLSRNYE